MKERPTLRSYVKDIVSPYVVSMANAVRRLRGTVGELNERIDHLPKTVDISRVVVHPVVTTSTITPNLIDGGIHEFTFNVTACTINSPILPTDWNAGIVKLYVQTNQAVTTLSLDASMIYTGGDGLYILQGQRYLMTVDIKDDAAYVSTQLVSG